mgnify:FL=1
MLFVVIQNNGKPYIIAFLYPDVLTHCAFTFNNWRSFAAFFYWFTGFLRQTKIIRFARLFG